MRQRFAKLGLLFATSLVCVPVVYAVPTTTVLTSAAVGTLTDNDLNGSFETVGPNSASQLIGGAGFGNTRKALVVEFAVPVFPNGSTLTGATFYLDDRGGGNLDSQALNVYLYAGNGSVSTADAVTTLLIGQKTNVNGLGSTGVDAFDLNLAVSAADLNAILAGGASYFGFFVAPSAVLANGSSDLIVLQDASDGSIGPRLTLQFETPRAVPEPSAAALGSGGLAAALLASRRRRRAMIVK